MLAAFGLEPTWRAWVWTAMLAAMGVACLVNARRCGRIHCRVTGPFLLLMAAAVVGYAAGVLPLGPHAWPLLGAMMAVGFAGAWWGSERLWGAFPRVEDDPGAPPTTDTG